MYNTVFVILIAVLIFGYVLERILDRLNLKHTLPELPEELSGIFDEEEYRKSQMYKRDNTRFSFLTSSLGLVLMLLVFFLGGFGWIDGLIAVMTTIYIVHVLIFFQPRLSSMSHLCWRSVMVSIELPRRPFSWIN